ncbi:MAG TPA: alkaline phosphatase family protein [Anaerolineae bacterium]
MNQKGLIEHVVIIVKENHAFDTYFGRFPGAEGDGRLAAAPNPPSFDPKHTHEAWLQRATGAVREQYGEKQIAAYFAYARQFTLCDNYYSEVAGPSMPNHLMLIAAASPIVNNPHHQDPVDLQPPFDLPSLPGSLDAAGHTWGNYGGYAFKFVAGLRDDRRNVHAEHFEKDAEAGKLPAVSWVYAPETKYNPHPLSEHPPGNVTEGMNWTVQQVNAIVKGGLWPHTAVFITWDDWGGWYDHVDPPNVERWSDGTQFRYGSRVGCLVLSPYAKRGYISKALHSHVSLVKFCEKTFGLSHLNARDAAADDMSDCFDFAQKPAMPSPASPEE